MVAQLSLKGSTQRVINLIFYLQLTKSLAGYEIVYPSNMQVYLEEIRKLVDFDFLKPQNIIRLFHPEFSIAELVDGIKDNFKSTATEMKRQLEEDDEDHQEELDEEKMKEFREAFCGKTEVELTPSQDLSGVESTNPVVNFLLPISCLIVLLLIVLIALCFTAVFKKYKTKVKELLQTQKKKWMWNFSI